MKASRRALNVSMEASHPKKETRRAVRIQCIQAHAVVALVGLAGHEHGHVPPLGQRRDGEGAGPG